MSQSRKMTKRNFGSGIHDLPSFIKMMNAVGGGMKLPPKLELPQLFDASGKIADVGLQKFQIAAYTAKCHEKERLILMQNPLPREVDDDVKGSKVNLSGVLHKTENDAEKGSHRSRHSPFFLTNVASDEETVISQSSNRSQSSASSWTDDGFEEEATEKVQQLLDAIDSFLYEGHELPEECKDLRDECQDWIHAYSHLRITGSKYNEQLQQEMYFIAADENTASNLVDLTDSEIHLNVSPINLNEVENENSFNKLSLMIRGLTLNPILSQSHCQIESEAGSPEYEEIIEQHGEYEELIAVDYSDDDNKPHSDSLSERKLENDLEIEFQQVTDRIMKHVWNEVIQSLKLVLAKRIDFILHGNECTPTKQSKKPEENYLTDESPLPRLSTSQAANQVSAKLHGLLTISSKALQNRNANRSMRHIAHTSAPASMVGTRLATPQKLLHKNSGGRLAPLERLSKTASPASTAAHYENLKPPTPVINPISPVPWGRHFPLPPIDSGQQSTTSTLIIPAIRKVKPNFPANMRMLSASIKKRSGLTTPNKWKSGSNNSTTVPISMANFPSNRLYSAVDSMQSYPVSFAAIGERPHMRVNGFSPDFRIQSASVNQRLSSSYRRLQKYDTRNSQDKSRLSSGYSYNNLERRNNR